MTARLRRRLDRRLASHTDSTVAKGCAQTSDAHRPKANGGACRAIVRDRAVYPPCDGGYDDKTFCPFPDAAVEGGYPTCEGQHLPASCCMGHHRYDQYLGHDARVHPGVRCKPTRGRLHSRLPAGAMSLTRGQL